MSDPDPASSRDTSASSESGRLDWRLLEILVCPACRGPLEYDYEAQELVSREAGMAYPIRDGIPIMLIDQARRLDSASPTQ